jgi:membrane-associated protein
MPDFIDLFLHLDKHLAEVVSQYGTWIYAILFAIIFCETGLVITPFLPGDSLLFAAGSLAAVGKMNVHLLYALLTTAAIVGDNVNYAFGRLLGEKTLQAENPRFLKKEHLVKTQHFFEKHGVKAIIIARFVPIVRTFTPFVAGAGRMKYLRFLGFDVLGGLLWTTSFIYGGYFFGNMPIVKENFTVVIMAIIILSIMPGVIEYWRHRTRKPGIP